MDLWKRDAEQQKWKEHLAAVTRECKYQEAIAGLQSRLGSECSERSSESMPSELPHTGVDLSKLVGTWRYGDGQHFVIKVGFSSPGEYVFKERLEDGSINMGLLTAQDGYLQGVLSNSSDEVSGWFRVRLLRPDTAVSNFMCADAKWWEADIVATRRTSQRALSLPKAGAPESSGQSSHRASESREEQVRCLQAALREERPQTQEPSLQPSSLVGSWRYGDMQQFVIKTSPTSTAQYEFEERLEDGSVNVGMLVEQDGFFQGELTNSAADLSGVFRVRLIRPNTTVSNFKCHGGRWEEDIIATRQGLKQPVTEAAAQHLRPVSRSEHKKARDKAKRRGNSESGQRLLPELRRTWRG